MSRETSTLVQSYLDGKLTVDEFIAELTNLPRVSIDPHVERYIDGAITMDELVVLITGYNPIVGYMMPHRKGYGVLCAGCYRHQAPTEHQMEKYTPIFRENIYPYKQHCCGCGKQLVEGRTPWWPNLFDGTL